ncbi:MAG: N-acetylmuramoyl-L-alanine amidase, partial [Pseudomonadota bacterium]
DWRRLALRGLAIWPEPADGEPPDPTRFRDLARTAGYTAEVDDETLLAAFRLRFRPGARGPLDARDMALAADIAVRCPVHRAALA